MAIRPARALTFACAAVVAAAAATIWLTGRSEGRPTLNRMQAEQMLPVIDTYLNTDAFQRQLDGWGYLASKYPKATVKTFCNARLVEIRPYSSRWRVGMVINCGEFTRHGNTLLEGSSGYPGIGEVALVSGRSGHYRVQSVLVGPPYWDQRWVDANFSSGAAALVLDSSPPTAPDPISHAWHVFGFPSGARAVKG